MTKACPEIYKIITKSMRFDFMDKENPWYEFNCRVVRFKISDDKYETIITNLSREEFSMEEIREIYNMRWARKLLFENSSMPLDSMHCMPRKENSYSRKSMHV